MSKWANRLKGALSETVILEQCLNSALTITDKTPQEALLSVIVSGQSRDSFKNNISESAKNSVLKTKQSLKRELTITDETKNAPTLTERLNTLIAAGVSFDVGPDDFQAFGASERENAFLRANKQQALFVLQRGYLINRLFTHSPELLTAFTTEVEERNAILTDGGTETFFEALREVTAEWISHQTELLQVEGTFER